MPPFIELMKDMRNPLLGILAGMLFTAIVQSSSATTGIVIVLGTQGFITLEAGIALIFRGECWDMCDSCFVRDREAEGGGESGDGSCHVQSGGRAVMDWVYSRFCQFCAGILTRRH